MTARGWLRIGLAILLAGLGGLVWLRVEENAPEIRGPAQLIVGAAGRDVEIELLDANAGLRGVRADLVHASGESALLEERFDGDLLRGGGPAGAARTVQVRIDPEALGLPDGDAFLRIQASDWSWRDGFRGNVGELAIPVTLDRRKPRIQVATGLTYIQRGGAGAVAYSISEPAAREGVAVGDAFFRGYPHPDDPLQRIALYAVPTAAPRAPAFHVVAEDAAGNTATATLSVVLRERALPDASVTLPQSFLDRTVRDLAEANGMSSAEPFEAFRRINTEMRQANEEKIRELTARSAETKLWRGPFGQLANSKVTSRFAEHRSYFVAGRKNSEAIHYGYDLASTAGAEVTAANAGRVVHAGDLGIYGNCVLIDHGIGLATLYGHLSQIDTNVGDVVEKGETLGRTGATGLAGGDHLHFAVLLGGTYVDPLEWWDPTWVRTHIDAHIAPSSP